MAEREVVVLPVWLSNGVMKVDDLMREAVICLPPLLYTVLPFTEF